MPSLHRSSFDRARTISEEVSVTSEKDPRLEPLPEAAGPYRPPAINWEEPFELEANLSSACGKLAADALCGGSPAS